MTCTENTGNRVKQCENLKKLKGANACCFSAIPAKICEKKKFTYFKGCLSTQKTKKRSGTKLLTD